MKRRTSLALRAFRAIVASAVKLRSDRRGNVAVMMGFLLAPLVGALGVGFEISNWYANKRDMQNAADAASVAAATNGGANYAVEAKAVAAQYGFVDGSNNVTVTVSNTAPCPSGGSTCYSVTINRLVPLYMAQVVGFRGDAVVNGSREKSLTATSVAQQTAGSTQYCMLALASSGQEGVHTNGAPKANMAGCNIMSDTTATCNGHDLNADIGDAAGTNRGCGNVQHSNMPPVTDPYLDRASYIPADSCGGSYPQEPSGGNDPALPASNRWSGNKSLSGNVTVCGDLQLTGDVTVDAPTGAVLIIYNGQLDTKNYKLSTTSGSGLTIVFSGSNGTYTHAPTSGNGTLDIAAPTSGNWSGVAIYQAPTLTSGVDISGGSTPTWKITGLVYLPHASVTFSGAVGSSSHGQSCFVLVVDNITINGTGSILSHGGCAAAGLTMPTGGAPGRGQLVM